MHYHCVKSVMMQQEDMLGRAQLKPTCGQQLRIDIAGCGPHTGGRVTYREALTSRQRRKMREKTTLM